MRPTWWLNPLWHLIRGKDNSPLGWRADSGATAIEYGIIAGLIAITIVVGAQISGNGLNRMFQVIGIAMSNATDSAMARN